MFHGLFKIETVRYHHELLIFDVNLQSHGLHDLSICMTCMTLSEQVEVFYSFLNFTGFGRVNITPKLVVLERKKPAQNGTPNLARNWGKGGKSEGVFSFRVVINEKKSWFNSR